VLLFVRLPERLAVTFDYSSLAKFSTPRVWGLGCQQSVGNYEIKGTHRCSIEWERSRPHVVNHPPKSGVESSTSCCSQFVAGMYELPIDIFRLSRTVFELFSYLIFVSTHPSAHSRPSVPRTTTNTALEAISSSSGRNEL
jgi:hypothetical protein